MYLYCFPNHTADVAMPPTVSLSLVFLVAIPVLTALIAVIIILLVEHRRKKRSAASAETVHNENGADRMYRQ